jgi:hypothetical protein
MHGFKIPEMFVQALADNFERRDESLYGRPENFSHRRTRWVHETASLATN